MNDIKWNDRFNLGIDSIDKAHQKLFSIVNKILSLCDDPDKQAYLCREGIKYLKNYTAQHFADEEAYMRSIHYSGYEQHKRRHDTMQNQTVPALEAELEAQNYSIESVQHFLGICIGWLNGHIMADDFAITGRIPDKWVHAPSDDETESLIRGICQSMKSQLGVDAKIVSDHYTGEDFSSGKSVCFRFTYALEDGRNAQVYLAYEERFALGILSEIVGKPINKVDKTVVYAIKTISQQLINSIGTHFGPQDKSGPDKKDILSFEQFIRVFEKAYPAYSLLFSTGGRGYFALCINILPKPKKSK